MKKIANILSIIFILLSASSVSGDRLRKYGFILESVSNGELVGTLKSIQNQSERVLSDFTFKLKKGEKLVLWLIYMGPSSYEKNPEAVLVNDEIRVSGDTRTFEEKLILHTDDIVEHETLCSIPMLSPGKYKLIINSIYYGTIIVEDKKG